MVSRVINFRNVFIAFLLTTLVFLGGFFLSYNLSYYTYSKLSDSHDELRYNILSSELQRELTDCDSFNPGAFSGDLSNSEGLLRPLEENLGKNNPLVIKEKNLYSLLEIQHYLIVRDYNLKCNKNITTLLFFYSNEEEFIDEAKRIGSILSAFKYNKNDVMVYSFDTSLNNNLINTLKLKFNITGQNELVFNDQIISEIDNIEVLNKIYKAH